MSDHIISHFDYKRWFDSNIQNIKWRGSEGQARCPLPSHGGQDKNPSFSVNANKGVFICHKEHISGGIKELAGLLGVENPFRQKDIPPKKPKGKLVEVAVYDYVDESGSLIYQVVRYLPKTFRQRRPDGADGWTWTMNDVKPIPYRLPELLKALAGNELVFIAEGEKDVDNLFSVGLSASCNHGGAGRWTQTHTQYFPTGADIIILLDNDEPGREHSVKVANQLVKRGCRVRVVELPGLPEKGDVSDWLAAGGTKKSLLALVEQTEYWKPGQKDNGFNITSILRPPDPTKKVQIEWIVPDMIPAGYVTLLIADPKSGKTWLSMRLACDLSSGGVILGGLDSLVPARRVLYLMGDTGEGLVNYRLHRTGWPFNAGNIRFVYAEEVRQAGVDLDFGTDQGVDILRQLILAWQPHIVFVDTLTNFHSVDESKNSDVKPIIASLRDIAAQYNIALVVLHHARKRKTREVDLPISQHDSVGAGVLSRLVGNIIGIERRIVEGKQIHLVRSLASWFREFDQFTFSLEDVEKDGQEMVEMKIDLTPDLGQAAKDTIEKFVFAHYITGSEFTRQEIARRTGIGNTYVSRVLNQLVKDGKLESHGKTKDKTFTIIINADSTPVNESLEEKDPLTCQDKCSLEGDHISERITPQPYSPKASHSTLDSTPVNESNLQKPIRSLFDTDSTLAVNESNRAVTGLRPDSFTNLPPVNELIDSFFVDAAAVDDEDAWPEGRD
ncbi:MAG: Regulatory protein RepA [Pelotomaculum sp. PtaB.Bin104]|nr:MAG: Regulatory protein RepA [Pelotomaculum sp. PtaB.Bin104]